MLNSSDEADGFDELAPAFPLRLKNLFAGRSEPIIATPALSGFLDPASTNPAAFLEAIEEGIKGSDVEAQGTARTELDELADIVAMAGPVFHEGENEELGAALLQFAIKVR
jgi:hypothetical protein